MGGRKKQHTGLLAVDPSWKGMGVAAYVPVHDWSFVTCADIRNGRKGFDLPQMSIKLVTRYFKQLFEEEPHLRCCSRIVIENQFKTKMRYLSFITATCLQTLMPHATVEFVSILKLKKHFQLECTGSHYQNKKAAVTYVSSKERELINGSMHGLNDNICDAILLLNYSIESNKLCLMNHGNCNVCDNPLVERTCQNGDNAGRMFVNCPNGKRADGDQPANKCNRTFHWLDEDGKIIKSTAGQKRSFPASDAEVKRQKVESLLVEGQALLSSQIDALQSQIQFMEGHLAELESRTQKLEDQ